jgi:hypothetical protein
LTATLESLAVGDEVFVHADDDTTLVSLRGSGGVVTMLDANRAQIRLRGNAHELVWIDLGLLRRERRRPKRLVEWPRQITPQINQLSFN